MRIKPKNPKVQRLRRVLLGVAGLAVILFVLLRLPDSPKTEIVDPAAAEVTATAIPAEVANPAVASGDLAWEYPEGWVDYSDLPAKEELGDEDQPGLSNWRYILVNGLDQSNYLRKTYFPDIVEAEHGYFFQRRAVDDLKSFLAAARDEGYTVSMSRTYLSYEDQRVRFNGMASTIYDRGGCTLAEAEEQASELGYFPGADEHQTGLAVNFVDETGEAKFSTPVLIWMREHCAEYGFILRYPEGREEYTGRDAEAGHFRYVGPLVAEYIMRKGITLEEFLGAYEEDEEIVWDW